MKTFITAIALGFLFLVAQANAVEHPRFSRNLALTCGDIAVLTTEYTTAVATDEHHRRLVGGKDGDLGEVTAVRGSQTLLL